jgi:GntR family transcriptional regulator
VHICVYCAYRVYTDGVCVTEALFLSQNDSRPMYLQIMEQIKQKVRAGDWPAGHPLPSIRELSVSTQVSVITVKRAYTELEMEGVIVTQAGRGSFVADSAGLSEELVQMELEKTLDIFIVKIRHLGLSDTEIVAQLKKALIKSRV